MPDFDTAGFPDNFVVPFIDIVHDRAVTEVLRGCIRGSRFCQAGYIYRPYRERSAAVIDIKEKMNNLRNNSRVLIAHLSIFLACAFWGLMAPLGKDAMTHGVTGLDMQLQLKLA